jgi:hypothetical protein
MEMIVSSDPIADFKRLRVHAQQIRATAIRSRIMTSQTFCAIAEDEARWSPDGARETLSKVRRSIDEIERHIAEPDHISRESANELTELLPYA